MLILSNEEIESLLNVDLALKCLERAYIGQAQGTAVNRPRSDLYLPGVHEGSVYAFKTMEGGLVESKMVALRLNSDVIRWQERENRVVKDKLPMAPGKKWVGLIQLFSAETGEPLAMFPDGVIQRMRVAVTSALAAREMARQDAAVMAIFGSGWQVGAHVPAFCAVRRIKRITAFSPTRGNREKFATEMEKLVGVQVQPMNTAEEAARDADILVAATNAVTHVIEPEWLKPGVHFTCVKDCELGGGFFFAANKIDGIMGGNFLIVPGRKSAQEITCFINNIGLGIQFAAVGGAIYSEAKAKGIGKEIPTDWFLETVHP
jgi:alanine dehydrogenase